MFATASALRHFRATLIAQLCCLVQFGKSARADGVRFVSPESNVTEHQRTMTLRVIELNAAEKPFPSGSQFVRGAAHRGVMAGFISFYSRADARMRQQ